MKVDECSEVETVIPSNTLFSVDVNIDNLKDYLGSMNNYIQGQDALIRNLEVEIKKRASEKGLGMYLERISVAVP